MLGNILHEQHIFQQTESSPEPEIEGPRGKDWQRGVLGTVKIGILDINM